MHVFTDYVIYTVVSEALTKKEPGHYGKDKINVGTEL